MYTCELHITSLCYEFLSNPKLCNTIHHHHVYYSYHPVCLYTRRCFITRYTNTVGREVRGAVHGCKTAATSVQQKQNRKVLCCPLVICAQVLECVLYKYIHVHTYVYVKYLEFQTVYGYVCVLEYVVKVGRYVHK